MSKRIIVTILLCGGLYLLGNARVSLWDRDEPRYAQASRQMLQSGDWVVPKLLDEPRIKKPPMIYWCQAASMSVFEKLWPDAGRTPDQRMQRDAAAARLPSSVAIVLTLILIAFVLVRLLDEERAFWTVLVFGTSGLVIMAAKMCLTDAVLLLFVTASQFCLYAMYRGRATWGVVVGFAVSTALGLLTKGPVVLGVNLVTLIVLALLHLMDRRKSFNDSFAPAHSHKIALIAKILVVLAIIVAICLPWVLLIWQRLKAEAIKGGQPVDLWGVFKHEVIERMTTPLEQHKGPPGYYLLFFFASFFPWSLMLPTAIKLAWQNRREPLIRFAFAAVVGPWIMFECIATKLPHYVLPCFPFLAILTATAIVRGEHREWNGRPWMIGVGVWSLAVVALGTGLWLSVLPRFGFEGLPYPAMSALSLEALFFAVLIFLLFARRQIAAAAFCMGLAMLCLMALLFGFYLPDARFLHLSENVGAYLQQAGATQLHDVAMIDYKEDSLPFYQGGTIRPQRLNDFLNREPPENWPTFLVITREIWNSTSQSAKAHLEVLRTFHGLAYAAKGRVVDVMVVKKKAH